jgi:hypothetical protein
MKKNLLFILSAIAFIIAIGACNNQNKTVQEYLREEKKAIERYIDRQGIVVLKEYPEGGVFKEKEYYKTNDGLYIHVVDSGNGTRATPLLSQVQVRFEYMYNIKSFVSGETDSIVLPYYYFPQSFVYGLSGSYGKNSYDFSCNGWAIPLNYVGKEAVVDLIIPSALGAYFDNSYPNYNPVFYKNLTYTNFF